MTLKSIRFEKNYISLVGLYHNNLITKHLYYQDITFQDLKWYLEESHKLDKGNYKVPFSYYLSDCTTPFSESYYLLFVNRNLLPSYIASSPNTNTLKQVVNLLLSHPDPIIKTKQSHSTIVNAW